MSFSDDESDFQSADEDGFDDSIPVQGSSNIGYKVGDIDDSDIPDPEVQSSPPPAPPPTPALSSSFNSEDTLSQITGSGTQYAWRISPKIKENQQESAQLESLKNEQARIALDKLSEMTPYSEKSLFGKIAEDVKKVTITGDRASGGPVVSSSDNSKASSSIPLFSELSSSLGGWNWNGASKLLASASQMTSQVGSVLDSVVNNKAQNLQPGDLTSSSSSSQKTDQFPATEVNGGLRESELGLPSKSQNKAAMSASEANSNDALVDLTLNAMESLGKKAFGVMTERDESGTLQIKGLGRPWEHLLNKKKGEQLPAATDNFNQSVEIETLNEPTTKQSTVCYEDNIKKIEQPTLKNRRKRPSYSNDDDKLD